jgi:hypothetical protein
MSALVLVMDTDSPFVPLYPMLSTLGRSAQEDPGEDLGLRGPQCGPNIC